MTKNEFLCEAQQGKRLVSEFSLNNMPKEIIQMALFAGYQAFENKELNYQDQMNSVLMAVEAAYHYGKSHQEEEKELPEIE